MEQRGELEAGVGQGQVEDAALPERGLAVEPDQPGEALGHADELGREVDAGHLAAIAVRQEPGRAADARAQVQDGHAGGEVELVQQPDGRLAAADMELVDRRQIVDRDLAGRPPLGAEPFHDRRLERAVRVVAGDGGLDLAHGASLLWLCRSGLLLI